MSDYPQQLPEKLAAKIFADFRPVRPLLPLRARAAVALTIAFAGSAGLLATLGVRADIAQFPSLLFGSMLAARIILGAGLIIFALSEALPAAGFSGRSRSVWLVAGVAALVILPATFATLIGFGFRAAGAQPLTCFLWIAAVSVPSFAVVQILVRRGYAFHPVRAGFIAGLGSGLLTESAQFAACANPALIHQCAIHGGAVMSLAILGASAGWLGSRTRASQRP